MQNPWGRAKCQIREKVKEHSEKRIELLFWTMAILNSKIEEMNKKYQSDLQSQTSEVRQGRVVKGGMGGSWGRMV